MHPRGREATLVERPDDAVGARILDAALELLRARGPKAVTMQAIVDATGIAKTTIYRRHPNRRSLLAAALETLDERPSVSADADREQRLRWVIEQSVDVIARGIGAGDSPRCSPTRTRSSATRSARFWWRTAAMPSTHSSSTNTAPTP